MSAWLARLFISMVFLAETAGGSALQAPAIPLPEATGLILGTVVEAATGGGIPNALVQIRGTSASFKWQQVVSDASGKFLFRGLPRGQYSFFVGAQGYVPNGQYGLRRASGLGQPLDLADGATLTDVVLRLWKYAAIEGSVTDEVGEPVVQVKVYAFSRETVAGHPAFVRSLAVARTDDRGIFHLSDVVPGSYVVGIVSTVTSTPQATADALLTGTQARRTETQDLLRRSGAPIPKDFGFQIGDAVVQATSMGTPVRMSPPNHDGHLTVVPSQFYRETSDLTGAATIKVDSGEVRQGVDMQLRAIPTAEVSGLVVGPAGPGANIAVRLVPASISGVDSEDGLDTSIAITNADGHFTLFGVPPGSYVLSALVAVSPQEEQAQARLVVETAGGAQAVGPSISPLSTDRVLWDSTKISLGTDGSRGTVLTLKSGSRLAGHIEFDDSAPKPTAQQLSLFGPRMVIERADGRVMAALAAPRIQVQSDGQFRSTDLMPGTYVLRISGAIAGWTAKDARSNGSDLLSEPFNVNESSRGDILVTFTQHPARVTGMVRDGSGNPDKSAAVVIFPVDRRRWTDHGRFPIDTRRTRVGTTGTFTVSGLPPGNYFVVALDDAATDEWDDPARLAAYAGVASTIALKEAEVLTLNLRTAVVR